MNIYYQDDLVTLYHGDCLQDPDAWTLADVLVTDPPYGMGWVSGQGSYRANGELVKHFTEPIAGDEDTTTRDTALKAWGERPAIVFGTWKIPRPAGVDKRVIWDKEGMAPGPVKCNVLTTDEEIYFIGSGFVKTSPPMQSVITTHEHRSAYVTRIGHPTPKPLALMETLVGRCPAEWVIADPFAGSGSTLIAARNLGRHVIGVEVNEAYCEPAAKRLAQGALPLGV